MTVLFVDVDGLKQVNDAFGHDHGDRLLGDLAGLMKATFRSSDVIGRVGGDEFCALLLDDGTTPAAAARLRHAVDDHNTSGGRRYHLSCSIGVVNVQPANLSALADLLAQADRAMYEEKRSHSSTNTDGAKPLQPLPCPERIVPIR